MLRGWWVCVLVVVGLIATTLVLTWPDQGAAFATADGAGPAEAAAPPDSLAIAAPTVHEPAAARSAAPPSATDIAQTVHGPAPPEDPGVRHCAQLAERTRDGSWGRKFFDQNTTLRSILEDTYYNPSGLTPTESEQQRLQQLLIAWDDAVESARREQFASLQDAFVEGVRSGQCMAVPPGDAGAVETALERLRVQLEVPANDPHHYAYSTGPGPRPSEGRVVMVTRRLQPRPFILKERIEEVRQRGREMVRQFFVDMYTSRGVRHQ